MGWRVRTAPTPTCTLGAFRGFIFSSIVFSKSGRMGESSLWSVGVDGSDLRPVVSGTVQGEWLLR